MKKIIGEENVNKICLLSVREDESGNTLSLPEDDFDRVVSIINKTNSMTSIIDQQLYIYPNILKHLKKIASYTLVDSYLTFPVSFYEQMIAVSNINKIYAVYDGNMDISAFISKINKLRKSIDVRVKVLIKESFSVDHYKELAKKLDGFNFRFSPVVIHDPQDASYYTGDTTKYNDFIDLFKFTIVDDNDKISFKTEFDMLPNVGNMGIVRCDIKKYQCRFFSNGNFYFCRWNKKPIFNIRDVSDDTILKAIKEDNILLCDNVRCDIGSCRVGKKEILPEIDESLEMFSY